MTVDALAALIAVVGGTNVIAMGAASWRTTTILRDIQAQLETIETLARLREGSR
jgi:hypothetical protein